MEGDDPPPEDDSFRVITYETGTFGVVRAEPPARRAAPPPVQRPVAPPEEPAPPAVYEADEDDAGDEDGFEGLTLELDEAAHTLSANRTAVRRQGAAPPRRRRQRRKPAPRAPRVWLSAIRASLVIFAAALLVATIFSMWTPLPDEFQEGLNEVRATQMLINVQPTAVPTPVPDVRIGIIAGHSGPPPAPDIPKDPGAVCAVDFPDLGIAAGWTELEINESVADMVVRRLQSQFYKVDLLAEFDSRLDGYDADVLVSIHTNDCTDYGPGGTGYTLASAYARQSTFGADERLMECLEYHYGRATNMPRHQGITYDMTEYHTFDEVGDRTPVVIIELGFMRNDALMLSRSQELIAQGIVDGIQCFLEYDEYRSPFVTGS